MTTLHEHVQQLRELAMGVPSRTRMLDLAMLNVIEELAAGLVELDAGLQLHAETLAVVSRQVARLASAMEGGER